MTAARDQLSRFAKAWAGKPWRGWYQRPVAGTVINRGDATTEPGFRYVPLIFGNLPALAFLDTVQCIDCRDASAYVDWFHRLLCGLKGAAPGGDTPAYPKLTPPPAPAAVAAAQTAPAEQAFVQRVMRQLQLATSPPVMVTSPGRRHQGAVIAMLRAQGVSGFFRGRWCRSRRAALFDGFRYRRLLCRSGRAVRSRPTHAQ